MNIKYKECRDFNPQQIQELFLSVNWISGQYPERVVKGLQNSSQVISAWCDDKLIGLIRAFDD